MTPAQRVATEMVRKLGEITSRTLTKKGHDSFADQENYQKLQEHLEYLLRYEMGKSFPESVLDSANETHWRWQFLPEISNLIHGYPAYTIALMKVDHAEIETAVVLNVAMGQEYSAARGSGAMCTNRRIRVRKHHHQLFYAGDQTINATRRDIGSSLLSIAQLAEGSLDAVYYRSLNEFEHRFARFFIQEAGGVCCDFQGKPLSTSVSELIATERSIQQRVLAYISSS